jgi:Sec-independent protein translocase protein TatA
MSDHVFDLKDSIDRAHAESDLLTAIKQVNEAIRQVKKAVEQFENTFTDDYNSRDVNDFKPFIDFYPFQVSLCEVDENWGDIDQGELKEKS